MKPKGYLALYLLALFVNLGMLFLQKVPGYMDAAYYYSSGLEIASGNGLVENFLWNYLDNPSGIPHPSHLYWMPLPSLLAALSMLLTGSKAFISARVLLLFLAAAIPPLTAWIGFKLSGSKVSACLSGLLAVFPGFYAIFLTLPESFALYMLLASLFIVLLNSKTQLFLKCAGLGAIAGLMHLSRADGIVWFVMGGLGLVFLSISLGRKNLLPRMGALLAIYLLTYAAVMGFWFGRNHSLFGTVFPPGNSSVLWLTDYDQTFRYPADKLGLSSWLMTPLAQHIHDRIIALGTNLKTAVGVQGQVFLLPFILIGGWRLRKDRRVQWAFGMWLISLGVMTVLFPYAGSRGGFFHSGAALQPFFWALAPVGLRMVVERVAKFRPWQVDKATLNFGLMFVFVSAVMTGGLVFQRVIGENPAEPAWETSWREYTKAGQVLESAGIEKGTIIMVNNPPEFWLASGYPSIVIPDADEGDILKAANRYGAQYLLLEKNSVKGLDGLYSHPETPPRGYQLITSWSGTHLYRLAPTSSSTLD